MMIDNPWAVLGRRIGSQNHPQKRALDLLFEFLTPGQQEEYLETDSFTFTAESGRRYQIGEPVLWEHDQEGRKKTSFCIHPRPDDLPKPDRDLNIFLWLMANERKVRASAGRYGGYPHLNFVPEELQRVVYRAFEELTGGPLNFVKILVLTGILFVGAIVALAISPFLLLWKLLRAVFGRT